MEGRALGWTAKIHNNITFMQYVWNIDTPWAKKGEVYFTVLSVSYRGEAKVLEINRLLSLGWIKPVEEKPCGYDGANFEKRGGGNGYEQPVEEKKLTEEEILEAITWGHGENLDIRALAKLLAEHLNN